MADESLMSTNEPLPCQNCDSILEEGFDFCPHCGQKTNDELTIGVLFYNTISNYFSFDARFLKSFAPLMFKPGYLAEKFLQGKRLLYLHPAQMYLFVSVIFFFIISFSTRELVKEANEINKKVADSEFVNKANDSLEESKLDSIQIEKLMKPLKDNQQLIGLKESDLKMADSLIKLEAANPKNMNTTWDFDKKKIDSLVAIGADNEVIYREMGMSDDPGFLEKRLYTRMLSLAKGQGAGSIVQAFFDSIPISMFFLLPFFALILKIFYYNKGKYVYHLVFSFYYFSFLFTVFSILFALNNFFEISSWISWLIAISTYFYFLIALIRFYKQHWFLTWVKSGLITFVFLLFVIPTTAGILIAFSFFTS